MSNRAILPDQDIPRHTMASTSSNWNLRAQVV